MAMTRKFDITCFCHSDVASCDIAALKGPQSTGSLWTDDTISITLVYNKAHHVQLIEQIETNTFLYQTKEKNHQRGGRWEKNKQTVRGKKWWVGDSDFYGGQFRIAAVRRCPRDLHALMTVGRAFHILVA